jgi:hypothetical protein
LPNAASEAVPLGTASHLMSAADHAPVSD